MAGEWRRVTLAAICHPPDYGAIAKGGDEYSGPLFIRQTDIVSGRVDWSSVPRCSLDVRDSSKFEVRRGDLLISRLGAGVGNAAVVLEPNGSVFAGYLVRFRPHPHDADPFYLAYQLQSQAWKDHVRCYGSGAAQPTLNAQQMGAFRLSLPPLPTQRAIAHILGALDDKIELNRKTNETLEAMARALFQSWFVDFDPVRAKAAGRAPEGMDEATAKLFPSEFEQSELGEVPKGWRQTGLDELARFVNGLPLQRFRPREGDAALPIVKIQQLRTGIADWSEAASAAIEPTYIIDDGDIVFSWSGSLLVDVWAGGRAALNQHLFRVIPIKYGRAAAYLWIRHHLPEFQLIAADKATTMGHIQRKHLSAAKCVVPPDDAEGVFWPLDQLLQARLNASLQSRTLAALRDALLPKLLSGELAIRDAETFVSRAV